MPRHRFVKEATFTKRRQGGALHGEALLEDVL
jgi:hypothetical protein